MPTYEYECLPNKHRFELKQSFTDDALIECQVCDEPVRKVFSAAGIVFKGSGYYVTDSRKAPANGKAQSESSSKDGGDGSSAKDSGAKDSAARDSGAKDSASSSGSGSSGESGSGSSSKAGSGSGTGSSRTKSSKAD